MRLFIAIPAPGEIAAELLRAQEQLPAHGAIRLTDAFHLTLKFLGDMDGHAEVQQRLAGLRFAPFTLTLAAVRVFPNWDRISVIWVSCQQSRAVRELQFAIANRLKGIGKADDHPFHPHFTLARVAAALPAEEVAQIRSISVRSKSFTVEKFALYESTLTREGPVYREIAEFRAV